MPVDGRSTRNTSMTLDTAQTHNPPSDAVTSRITGGSTTALFQATVLDRLTVTYYRCDQTGYIQTEDPYWLQEAYRSAITALDVGILQRNLEKVVAAKEIIKRIDPQMQRFLDFGGGYGIFVRLMRDSGYAFELYDPHCQNLFAVGHCVEQLTDYESEPLDMLTAWEVLEHVKDPYETIPRLLRSARHVLFSTVLVPDPYPRSHTDWWYFTPETGQHIAFYTKASLQYIASKLGVYFYTDGTANHLLSHDKLKHDPFERSRLAELAGRVRQSLQRRFPNRSNRKSLLQHDYEQARQALRASNQ
jgi:hypothetical protein